LVGSLGFSCRYKRFLFCLGCSWSAQYKIFLPHRTLFQFICPHAQQAGQQSCLVACLSVHVSCMSSHCRPTMTTCIVDSLLTRKKEKERKSERERDGDGGRERGRGRGGERESEMERERVRGNALCWVYWEPMSLVYK
jgi:hypothetical protein